MLFTLGFRFLSRLRRSCKRPAFDEALRRSREKTGSGTQGRLKCSYGKISSPLTEISVGKTEISGTEPARPLIYTHRNFTKYLEVGRDLGNRDSPRVNWCNVTRPIDRRHQDWGTSEKKAQKGAGKHRSLRSEMNRNQYCEKVRKVFYYAVGRMNESRTISMRENKHFHWFITSSSFFHRKIYLFSEWTPEIKQKFVFTNWVGIDTIKGAEELLFWLQAFVREGFLRKIACVAAGPRFV